MKLILFLLALLPAFAGTGIPAVSGAIQHIFTATVPPGVAPVLTLWAPQAEAAYFVECTAGEHKLRFETGSVPPGEQRTFALSFPEGITHADCAFNARFPNGLSERRALSLDWKVEKPRPKEKDGEEKEKKEPAEATPPAEVPPAESVPPLEE